MSLLDIVADKYETPARGAVSALSAPSQPRAAKAAKAPRPTRSELQEEEPNEHRDKSRVVSVDQWSKNLRESPDELRRVAGDDWEEVSADIVVFADAVAVNQIRESGASPSSYTSETFCRKCNCCVPFYEGVPEIGSCSWCRQGQTSPAIPGAKE